MNCHLENRVHADLTHKMVFLTGPRKVSKTTLSRQLIAQQGGHCLSYDVPANRSLIIHQRWNSQAPLLVLDETDKMPDWKAWLKGLVDGAPATQQLLVTGRVRMDAFRPSGESLQGRFLGLRLHPLSEREWCEQTGATTDAALTHLLEPGGFHEPCLAPDNEQAERRQYFDGLVRKVVLVLSPIQEVSPLLMHVQWHHDIQGKETGLHFIRTKDGAEMDFALNDKNQLTQWVECKLSDEKPYRALLRFALDKAPVQAVQVVRHARHSNTLGNIQVGATPEYLNGRVA